MTQTGQKKAPRQFNIAASAETVPQQFTVFSAPIGEGRLTYAEAIDLVSAHAERDALRADNARLMEVLNSLVSLHCDWEPQGRATKRLCEINNELVQKARAALAASGGDK